MIVLELGRDQAVVADPSAVAYRTDEVERSRVVQGDGWIDQVRSRIERHRAGLPVTMQRLAGPGQVGLGRGNGRVEKVRLAGEGIVTEASRLVGLKETVGVSVALNQQLPRRGGKVVLLALSGEGWVLMQPHGRSVEVDLKKGEALDTPVHRLAWYSATAEYEIRYSVSGGWWRKRTEGLVARVTGPGAVTLDGGPNDSAP